MTNKNKLAVMVAVLAAMSLVGCRRSPEEQAERIVKVLSRQLDLNDEQRAKLEAVKVEIQAARVEWKDNRADSLDTLIKQVKSKELDPTVLRSLVEQRRVEIDRLSPKVIAKVVEFHATLSDAQKEQVATKLAQFKKFTTE